MGRLVQEKTFAGSEVMQFRSLRGWICSPAPIDSAELIDSTMVRNAKNGYKGKFFIQFSFSRKNLS